MTQQIFDAGIFCIMLIIGFVSLYFYQKIGALMLAVSVITFLVSGLIIVTGYDVAFFTVIYPANVTSTITNGSSVSTTTITQITPENDTHYLIGNGSFPITGIGQLWMGYGLILLSLVVGVIFLDQTLKGNLVKGD